jgi:hypothetical protein
VQLPLHPATVIIIPVAVKVVKIVDAQTNHNFLGTDSVETRLTIMISSNRDILVLSRHEGMNEQVLEKELECLHNMLHKAEAPENFCRAHELVDRNRITSRPKKILSASRFYKMKPFRFLINKN